MEFLLEKCTFTHCDEKLLSGCSPFDCGHADLNDFFRNDAVLYSQDLVGKTYCFTLDEDPSAIVCAFTVSNDSIKTTHLPGSRRRRVSKGIARVKQMNTYPAVLIGRLGVNLNFKRKGIGRELMDFIKGWFRNSTNKTGCRFVVVDAYNEAEPLGYYVNNGFDFLFTSEDQEREYLRLPKGRPLSTRLMFFDLILLDVED